MSTEVILVDDHQLMRDGLRTLLQTELGIEVVGEAEHTRAIIDEARFLKRVVSKT